MGVTMHRDFLSTIKSNKSNLAFLCLISAALLAGVSFDFAPEVIWHDQQRIEQVFFLAVMSLGVASVWRNKFADSLGYLKAPGYWGLGLFFALGGISVYLSGYPRFAGLEWVTIFLLMTAVVMLAGESRRLSERFDFWAIRLVVALAVVVALKSMMGFLALVLEDLRLDSLALFESTFSNRRVFGQMASIVIPLLAYGVLSNTCARITKRFLFVLLAVWWMLVIASGTRGSWVALGLAAAILALINWRVSAGWLKVQSFALIAGLSLFLGLFVWLPGWLGGVAVIENRMLDIATLSNREILWGEAWKQIQLHPWFGVGPMHLAATHNGVGAHPHNMVLQLAAEWGLPAAAALLFVIGRALLRLLKKLRNTHELDNPLLVCLAGSLLAAIAQAMVDGVIVIPYIQLCLVFVAGWTLGMYNRQFDRAACVLGVRKSVGLMWPVFFMMLLAVLLYGVFPEALHRAEITQAYLDAGNTLIPPRYWGVGWIP